MAPKVDDSASSEYNLDALTALPVPEPDSDDSMDLAGAAVQTGTAGGHAGCDLARESGSDDGGLVCASDSDAAVVGPKGWVPGVSCGAFVGKQSPLTEQCQVLLVNVVLAAHKLPRELQRAVLEGYRNRASKVPLYLQIAARWLCMSASRVQRTFAAISKAGWQLVPASRAAPAPEDQSMKRPVMQSDGKAVLKTLVRASLAESVSGSSANAFVKHLSRLALEGVDIGGKFHTRHFVRDSQHLAAKVLQASDRLELDRPLEGLGIPSSFALLFDGVPVGGVTSFSRHGNVEVICLGSVSRRTGQIHARFVTWAISVRGHKGVDTAQTILDALAQHPLCLDIPSLRRRLAAIGGDGAVVRGGPERQKPGTQAADLLWFRVHPHPGAPQDDEAPLAALAAPNPAGPEGVPAGREWLSEPTALHTVTEWDKFHRLDIALTRAIGACGPAQELYSCCALLDHLFGLGDGRLLLRAAAEESGSQVRGGRLPGMTRKGVQLCTEPGHLLDNFRAYCAGLHLREAWRMTGHDKKAGQLLDAGRRLTAVETVSFAMMFRDVMGRAMSPWVRIVQTTSLEPWVVRHKWLQHERCLAATASALLHFRQFLRILVLLRQWVPAATLEAFARALFYARPSDFFAGESAGDGVRAVFGHLLPALCLGFPGVLHSSPPTFQGVGLLCVPEPREADSVLIGPHCQCPFLQAGRRRVPRRVKIGRRARQVQVPLWAGGPRDAWCHQGVPDAPQGRHGDSGGGSRLPGIRWQWRHVESLHMPPGVPPEGRYRRHIRVRGGGPCSSCVLPSRLPHLFLALDSAAAAAESFIQDVLKEERRLLGSEGTTTGLAEATRLMSQCFDWGRLTETVPIPADIHAFRALYRLLKPILAHTQWPAPADFPDVVHAWPDENALCLQYVLLLSRIRAANKGHAGPAWRRPVGYRVSRVTAGAELRQVVRGCVPDAPRGRERNAVIAFLASTIASYLDGDPLQFTVSPAQLARLGFPWRGRRRRGLGNRTTVKKWAFQWREPGKQQLAVLLLPGSAGRLVHVLEEIRELDWSAVSASIDCDPFFARDGPKRSKKRRSHQSAWHAARIHHQCRLMGVPEAACERVGSAMKLVWNRNQAQRVATLMNIVLLSTAGVECAGSSRDEELCDAVAEAMARMGRTGTLTAVWRRAVAGMSSCSMAVQNLREDSCRLLREAGRSDHLDGSSSGTDGALDLASPTHRGDASGMHGVGDMRLADLPARVKTALRNSQPAMALPDAVRKTLQGATAGGRIDALPLWRDRRQKSKRGRGLPKSSCDSLMRAWLESEDGKEWQRMRNERMAEAYGVGSDESSGDP